MRKIIMSFALVLMVLGTVFAQDSNMSKLKSFEETVSGASVDYEAAKKSVSNIIADGKEVLNLAKADLKGLTAEATPPAKKPASKPARIPTKEAAKTVKKSKVSDAVDTSKNAVATVYNDGTGAIETVYEDGKGVVSTAYNDAKGIVEYGAPKLEAAVISLANGLKVGAEELFKILVVQQIVYSIVYLFVLILAIGLSRAFLKEKEKYTAFISTYVNNKDISASRGSVAMQHWAFMIMYIGGAVIAGSIFIQNITTFVMGFVNPKYGAIMEIFQYAEKFLK